MKRSPGYLLLIIVVNMAVLLSCGGGGGSTATGGGGDPAPGQLSITSSSLPDGYTGLAYDQTLTSTGGKAPIKWSYSGFFPSGLLLSSAGHITGTVTNAVYGDVDFIATDSSTPAQVVHKAIRMTFHWGLDIPTPTLGAAHVNAPYGAVIRSSGPVDASSWRVSKGTLPPGLALKSPTATQVEIAGTPSSTGTYDFTVQAESSNPRQVASRDCTLVVDSNLAISPAELPDGIVGVAYSLPLSVSNGTPPYTWSSTFLPAGLTLNSSTGLISGTPSGAGNYVADITVRDSASPQNSGLARLGIEIAYKLHLSDAVWNATIGKQFSATVTGQGGENPLVWTLLSGTLPPGITFDAQYGKFSGVPTEFGVYRLSVQARDASQQIAQASVTITVKPPELVLHGSLPSRLPLNIPFNGTAVVTGGIPPYTWSVQSGNLPPGLNLTPSTGQISGTPDTAGTYVFVMGATDSASPAQTVSGTDQIMVTPGVGRNDSVVKATPIVGQDTYASISPYADPPDSTAPAADSDYYEIIGNVGDTVTIEVYAARWTAPALDSVLEIVDGNGQRLSTCREPGGSSFTSDCMNDDIPGETSDSRLELQVPGAPGRQTTFYAHVLDARGDARPDMRYYLRVSKFVPPLRISTRTTPFICATGIAWSSQLEGLGGTAPLTWTLDSGALPPGFTLSADGVLSGAGTAAGTYEFVVRATDAASPAQTATASFSMEVEGAPAITTATLPDARTGVLYWQQLEATGGTPPYVWGLGWSGCSQNCLTMELDASAGILHGVPVYPGTFIVKPQLQDHKGIWVGTDLSVTVLPGPLVAHDVTMSGFRVGAQWSGSIRDTTGGSPPYNFVLADGVLPPGLTLSTSTFQSGTGFGQVAGVPTTAGTYTFAVKVNDSGQPLQSSTIQVTVVVSP